MLAILSHRRVPTLSTTSRFKQQHAKVSIKQNSTGQSRDNRTGFSCFHSLNVHFLFTDSINKRHEQYLWS